MPITDHDIAKYSFERLDKDKAREYASNTGDISTKVIQFS
jgi:hypothetical protein